MMKDNNEDYSIAYSQVDFFLQNLPESYISKLPSSLVSFIREQSSVDYTFDIDTTKGLFNQNYSNKAKALIAVLKYKYWSTNSEQEKLKILLENNEHNYVRQQEAYNSSFIFKNFDSNMYKNDDQLAMSVPYSSSFLINLKRLLLKILRIKK